MSGFALQESLHRHERMRIFVVVAVFAAVYIPSRLFLLLCFSPIGSDVDLYARFAFIHAEAHETGCSFYSLYRSEGLKDSTYAGYSLRDLTDIPYPPLAIGFLTIPVRFVLHGRSTDTVGFQKFLPRYLKAYRWVCLPFDGAVVLLALWLIITLFRGERMRVTILRSGMACGIAALLPHLLYDRLDIVLSALLLLSLAALIKKRWIIAFMLFAVAINFKPLPLFLAPLWVIGSIPAAGLDGPRRMALFVKRCAMRGLVLVLMGALVCIAALAVEGWQGLGFLGFHGARGIHIESSWGTFSLCAADVLNLPFKIIYDFGAFNVITSWTPFCAAAATALMIVLTAALTLAAVLRGLSGAGTGKADASMISQESLISLTAAMLLLTFCSFKMFSPQFLLLLIPIIPILPFRGPLVIILCALLAGACCMSTYIYPYFYEREIIMGPTSFGHFLLVTREVMLGAMLCCIVAAEFRLKPGILLCAIARVIKKSLKPDAPCPGLHQ
jgi:hypothetical protein